MSRFLNAKDKTSHYFRYSNDFSNDGHVAVSNSTNLFKVDMPEGLKKRQPFKAFQQTIKYLKGQVLAVSWIYTFVLALQKMFYYMAFVIRLLK